MTFLDYQHFAALDGLADRGLGEIEPFCQINRADAKFTVCPV
jgi:hypothetical protein